MFTFSIAILSAASLSGGPILAQCPPGYTADSNCASGCVSPNGYCAETTPRSGEERLTEFQYKASHNSYERSETLDEQIDDYNVWMLELDCWWLDETIYVRHLCGGGNGDLFSSQLDEILDSDTLYDRVTFLYLELKKDCTNDNCSCGFGEGCYPWPSDYRSQFESRLNSKFGNRVYTADEWSQLDNHSWPSTQELVRRDKNIVVFLDERCTGDGGNDYFFEVGGSGGYDALVNRDGGCDGGGSPDAATPTSRYLYRAYPGASCGGLCSEQNGGFWDDGTSLGYSFIATNCVSDSHTFDYTEIHSPFPTYVSASATGNDQRGTHSMPYVGSTGLWTGYGDATPATHFKFTGGGTYSAGTAGSSTTFDKAIQFQSGDSSSVWIMAP
jgi:hypothetical protein